MRGSYAPREAPHRPTGVGGNLQFFKGGLRQDSTFTSPMTCAKLVSSTESHCYYSLFSITSLRKGLSFRSFLRLRGVGVLGANRLVITYALELITGRIMPKCKEARKEPPLYMDQGMEVGRVGVGPDISTKLGKWSEATFQAGRVVQLHVGHCLNRAR